MRSIFVFLALAAALTGADQKALDYYCAPDQLADDPLGVAALLCNYEREKAEKQPPGGDSIYYCELGHTPAGTQGSACGCGLSRTMHHIQALDSRRTRCQRNFAGILDEKERETLVRECAQFRPYHRAPR